MKTIWQYPWIGVMALGFSFAILIAACSGSPPVQTATPTPEIKPVDELQGHVITLVATEWAFEPAQLDIPTGKVVTLVLENRGRTVHDVELEGIHADALTVSGEAADGHEEHEYRAEEAHSIHLSAEPGEKRWITFVAEESGNFIFYCTIPGHRKAGMEGNGAIVGEETHTHNQDHKT